MLWGAVVVLSVGPRSGRAQTRLAIPFEDRVPVSVRGPLVALIDSVAATGIPRDPLIDKALEGASKGADARRILAAVRLVSVNLATAQRVLGAASTDELVAGAAAIRAGVPANELAEIRRVLPGRSLTVPLSVLSAIVVQGASASDATLAVVAYAKEKSDASLLAFGRDVARQISAGMSPYAALVSSVTGPTRASGGNAPPKKPKP
jgi:hypothetical protein